ncbi:MAG: sporulation protein YhbH [Chloroflexota bacterium]|jgi:sporulation protein YhbH
MRTVSLSKHDWSLHRKAPADQARHNEKVKEAIKGNLADIVAEEAIVTSDGNKAIKVPIRSLELPHFRYDPNRKGNVGQGEGDSQVGDVLGQPGQPGPGQGKGAGDQPGFDYFEAEITIDELADLIFEDLGLPNLEQKQSQQLESTVTRFNDIRKSGPMSSLDKRRTMLENLRRNAKAGRPEFGGLKNDDLRFKTWTEDVRSETNAVIIAMRDVSGSMGEFEKYISRSFYFWMVKFLRKKYNEVKIVFITHHTEAKVVDEQTFFTLGESGGTKVSSAYRLALDVIKESYNPQDWNIYPFHFSDGDNWGETDNRLCLELVNEMLQKCNVFGYGEIRQGGYGSLSTLMSAFQNIQDPKFIGVTIEDKAGVLPALRKFFSQKEGEEQQ